MCGGIMMRAPSKLIYQKFTINHLLLVLLELPKKNQSKDVASVCVCVY